MIERDVDLLQHYKADVSGLSCIPCGVIRPRDRQDVVAAVSEAVGQGKTLLPIGAQTSTTGASVAADGGLVLDLAGLQRPPDLDADGQHVRVSPGTNLGQLHSWLHDRGLELPVDPTSSPDCTVGGAIATNASGPSTFRFGAMDQWVTEIVFVDGQGTEQTLRSRRVEKTAMGPAALADPVRMLVGSEGIFGAIVQANLKVIPRPADRVGVVIGFATRGLLFAAIPRLRSIATELGVPGRQGIRAIEWLDAACLKLLNKHQFSNLLPAADGGCLYIDVQSCGAVSSIDVIDKIVAIAQPDAALAASTVVLADSVSLRNFATIRHHVPETLNNRGRKLRHSGGGGKLSTDWSVPVDRLPAVFAWTDERIGQLDLEGVYAYGHIGNGHPHLNLICPTEASLQIALQTLKQQLQIVVDSGGVPVSEHGIGKLKRELVAPYMPPAKRVVIAALKKHFDPHGVFAPGNVI